MTSNLRSVAAPAPVPDDAFVLPALAAGLRMVAAALEESPKAEDRAMSAREVAIMLGLSPSTITTHVKRGDLKGIRYGRTLRIMRSDVDRFRESRVTV
jgi:excisionase family DNA binding protein